MKCKTCKNEIPAGAIFCNWCGARQVREPKKRDDIHVPSPRLLKSGKWNIELRAEGLSVTEDTAELCTAKAKAIRAGFLAGEKKEAALTVGDAMQRYIDRRVNTLSPATVRGYYVIKRTRFLSLQGKDIRKYIDWQAACNAEALDCSPKTLRNAWGFMASVLRENDLPIPRIRLPQVPPKDKKWLTPDQIRVFVSAVRGTEIEIPALMALCGLRRSEIYAVSWDKIDKACTKIKVSGAMVPDPSSHFVLKEANKNKTSTRTVPVMIPSLRSALQACEDKTGMVAKDNPNTLLEKVNNLCAAHDLPRVGVHGLRHSFASLAYHLGVPEREAMRIGGWADRETMHKIYVHLSQDDMTKYDDKLTDFYTEKRDKKG